MQKTGTRFEIGSYLLELYVQETRAQYALLPGYSGNDVGANFFRYLMPRAKEESFSFLQEMGIDPGKLHLARPLTEPDEKGEVLFLCSARLCGRLLRGGDTQPRRSEEKAGLSMVFVADKRQFHTGLVPFPDPELELRFVISLPFDETFFKHL